MILTAIETIFQLFFCLFALSSVCFIVSDSDNDIFLNFITVQFPQSFVFLLQRCRLISLLFSYLLFLYCFPLSFNLIINMIHRARNAAMLCTEIWNVSTTSHSKAIYHLNRISIKPRSNIITYDKLSDFCYYRNTIVTFFLAQIPGSSLLMIIIAFEQRFAKAHRFRYQFIVTWNPNLLSQARLQFRSDMSTMTSFGYWSWCRACLYATHTCVRIFVNVETCWCSARVNSLTLVTKI